LNGKLQIKFELDEGIEKGTLVLVLKIPLRFTISGPCWMRINLFVRYFTIIYLALEDHKSVENVTQKSHI